MALKYSTTRRPTPKQLLTLYAHAWWTKDRSAPQVKKLLAHSDLFSTAWDGAELVGFARVSTDFCFRAVIWDVIVQPSQQRKGLGRRLVQGVLKEPRLKSLEGFWLFTTDKQPFYKKLGFRHFPENLMVYRTPKAKVKTR